jgi:hypothetical protein
LERNARDAALGDAKRLLQAKLKTVFGAIDRNAESELHLSGIEAAAVMCGLKPIARLDLGPLCDSAVVALNLSADVSEFIVDCVFH